MYKIKTMKKTIFLATGLLFSVSAQAQILDIIKSTVKNQTGVDLNNPKTTTITPPVNTQQTPTKILQPSI
ncbi:hypothetical protein [Chryseobacterium indoltheticum]|uniref:hypothetical protein n=1 Tax=Chryseobacterium indoltheticum TaxID=254 RepID=UPI003F498984